MEIIYILLLVIAVLSNSILIIILSMRAERSVSILLFILLLYFINAWGVPQIIVNYFELKDGLFIAVDKISSLGYTFIPVIFLIFALSFVNKLYLLRSHLLLVIIFLPAIFFLYLAWNTDLIEIRNYQLTQKHSWGYGVPIGQLFPVIVIWFESLIISAMIMIIKFHRSTPDLAKKRQSIWLIAALLIPLIFGTVTNAILPILKIPALPSAIPLTSIMALIIAYAIIRHELFELSPLTILSSLGGGVITVNRDENIVQINQTAADLLGVNDALTGKAIQSIISLKDENTKGAKRINPVRMVLKTGRKFESGNFMVRSAAKKKFPVDLIVTPLQHKDNITGATLIFYDITKEKELEKNKNEFISIASHELKTPITSIKAYSQILQKQIQEDKAFKYAGFIAKINDQVDKITELINDLLNVGRIEAGKLVLNKSNFFIDHLIEKEVDDFRLTETTHTFAITGRTGHKVFADEERIGQVLKNLLTNAVKYSPQANKVIVGIAEIKYGIRISVQDFGIGIPEADHKKIFGRFYRSNAKTGRKITGFGLGLYISGEIIKRHGGRIWVEDSKPRGSTFYFTIPTGRN